MAIYRLTDITRDQTRVYITITIDGDPLRFTVSLAELQAIPTRAGKKAFIKQKAIEHKQNMDAANPYLDLIGDLDQ